MVAPFWTAGVLVCESARLVEGTVSGSGAGSGKAGDAARASSAIRGDPEDGETRIVASSLVEGNGSEGDTFRARENLGGPQKSITRVVWLDDAFGGTSRQPMFRGGKTYRGSEMKAGTLKERGMTRLAAGRRRRGSRVPLRPRRISNKFRAPT